ncbi:aminotransferase class V-fold PLP-dependent enzyme, partial [Gordonibacter urolithinfaciens]|uniref:aminotransferase class V-fold PLP-dependent enzyme n=1 Tax=Gordonibacter urolithinfaciens TaxID=1335613 RepID=UPI003A9171C4
RGGASAGAHCAQPLVRHLGAEAVCRASTGVYTSERDVDRSLGAVEAARQDAANLMTSAML